MSRKLRLSFSLFASILAVFMVLHSLDASAQRRASPDEIRKSQRSSRASARVKYISMHRMAGCGLGAQVFDSDEKFSQAAASLLNFTGLQSVMISFGISGCTYDGITEASRETRAFVESNVADIRHDMSLGSGEYLSALSSLYGCSSEAKSRFAQMVKSAYQENGQELSDPAELILMMNTVISEDNVLRQSCGAPQLAMIEN